MRSALCLAGLLLMAGMSSAAATAGEAVESSRPPTQAAAIPAQPVPPGPGPDSGERPSPPAAAPAAPPADSHPAPAAGAAAASDAQFFGELGYKDAATAADVARALTIFASEGKESGADFQAARAYLKSRGVLPDGWLDKAAADEPVSKSDLARLVCRTLGIRGGLWMRLFGPLPRLALRECVYLELMPRGADYARVSGGELVGVIDRCDRWREKEAGREYPRLSPGPAASEEKK